MSGAGAPSYRVLAVRYAEREITFEHAYYRWFSYGDPDGPLTLSYYFWLLEPLHALGAPPIVVDCGFDPAVWERMGRITALTPAQALARLGVDGAAVERLVISHLHYDHIGNVGAVPNARISVPRIEFEFWGSDPVAHNAQFAQHTDANAVAALTAAHGDGRVELIDDGAELAPGLTALHVGGHSPGQVVLEVAGEQGTVVLASDAVHYDDELERRRPFGVFSDLAGMYRGYDLLSSLASAGMTVVPGHEPAVMDRFAPLDGNGAGLGVCLTQPRADA